MRRLAGISGWAALAVVALLLAPRPVGLVGLAVIRGESMEPGLRAGDLAVFVRTGSYVLGDVVAYRVPDGVARGRIVIHRIVGGSPGGYVARGDNTQMVDLWRPTAADLEGRVVFSLAGGGRAVAVLRTPLVFAAIVTGIAGLVVLSLPTWPPRPRSRRPTGALPVAMLAVAFMTPAAFAAGLTVTSASLAAWSKACPPPPLVPLGPISCT